MLDCFLTTDVSGRSIEYQIKSNRNDNVEKYFKVHSGVVLVLSQEPWRLVFQSFLKIVWKVIAKENKDINITQL